MEHPQVFTRIYESSEWGHPVSLHFKGSSGDGSSEEYNRDYIAFLKAFIRQQEIKSVVDAGCGDWRCGKAIYYKTDVKYTGYDIYKEMIDSHNKIYQPLSRFWTFEVKNCLTDTLSMADADLLIIKDVLQHWSDPEVRKFLDDMVALKKYKYILVINCADESRSMLMEAGGWRTLSHSHPLLGDYGLIEIFKYNTKSVLLMKP